MENVGSYMSSLPALLAYVTLVPALMGCLLAKLLPKRNRGGARVSNVHHEPIYGDSEKQAMAQANEKNKSTLAKSQKKWECWAWCVAAFGGVAIPFGEMNFAATAFIASGLFAVASALCTRNHNS